MTKDGRLNDSLSLDNLFRKKSPFQAQPKAVDPDDIEGARDRLRNALKDISMRYWNELLGRAVETGLVVLSQPQKGTYAILTGLHVPSETKPTTQHSQDGLDWAYAADGRFSELVESIAAAGETWGFQKPQAVSVVGFAERVDGSTVTLRPLAVRDPDGLASFYHLRRGAYVPGLGDAALRLAELEKGTSRFDFEDPKALLAELLTALAENDPESFSEMCVDEPRAMQFRRYEQFLSMYRRCEGRVTFGHYDKHYCPENYPDCQYVKLFVRRELEDNVGHSPLVLVKVKDVWRLKRGAI